MKYMFKVLKNKRKNDVVEKYILDSQYATLSWSVMDKSKDTYYQGKRVDDQILISGKFKGKDIDMKINIDEKPFYFNPKLGLTDFVNAKEPSRAFWGIRHDNLKIYILKAKRKETKKIRVNGMKVNAVRVLWSPTRSLSKYFHRNYWFREKDGIYVRSKTFGGWIKGLVREKVDLIIM